MEMVSLLTPKNPSINTNFTYKVEGVNKDPEKLDYSIHKGPDPFAIQFYDVLWTEVDYEGEKLPLLSQNLNITPMIFIRGKIVHINDLLHHFYPEKADKIEQFMDSLSVNRVVKDGTNVWPFFEGQFIWSNQEHRKKYYEYITKSTR